MKKHLDSPLARAKGLGSSHEGASHWWIQRLTSIALIPLVIWCAFSVAMLPNLTHSELISWINYPLTSILIITMILATCYHMALGLRVIVEDYVHTPALKVGTLILINFIAIMTAIIGIYSVARLAL